MNCNPKFGAVNSPEALQGLGILFAIVPAAMTVIPAFCMIGYKLNDARQREIRRLLAERDTR